MAAQPAPTTAPAADRGDGPDGVRRTAPSGARIPLQRRPLGVGPGPVWREFTGGEVPQRESPVRVLAVRAAAVWAIAMSLAYLGWRVTATLSGATLWLAVPSLALEIWAVVSLSLHLIGLWDLDSVPPAAPVSDGRWRVAVLIATYNEPREVLLPTVAAACAISPEHQTWVLDDGNRPWVADLAASLGARYVARKDHAHAKAGNINAVLPELDVDLVAVLDADHVVRADFLRHTVGYFEDPSVALVQTPQDFYNLDSFEHIARSRGRYYCEQELFYRGLSAGRNRWNAAFWCGTNAVLRLSALRSVGGVATDSVTEDIHTTLRMHRLGWRSIFHNEVLARGLAASNSQQYFTQRVRWGTGAMQILRRENPALGPGLTFMQRVSYVSTLIGWFDDWRALAYLLLPIVTLLTGALPVSAPPWEFLAWFGATFGSQRLALAALSRDRAPQWHGAVFGLIRLPAGLRATTALFGRRPRDFVVTQKGRSGTVRQRMPAPRLLIGLLCASGCAAIVYGLVITGAGRRLTGSTTLDYPRPGVATCAAVWLVVNIVLLLTAVRRICDPRFGSDRRASIRFAVDGSALLDGAPADLLDISLTGARVALTVPARGPSHQSGATEPVTGDRRDPRHRAGAARATLTMALAESTVRIQVIICADSATTGRRIVGLEFADVGTREQARLALHLFRTGISPRTSSLTGP